MMYYEKQKNNSLGILLILIFLIIIIAILVSLINKIDKNFVKYAEQSKETGTDSVLADFSIENLVKNASYSVVGISKLNENNTSVFVENSAEKLGIGSGIVLSSNGYILTNYQLTGPAKSNCYVNMKNGNTYLAEVVWTNSELDISILKIPAENLLFLSLGDSDKISIGEEIYCLSNPTGYEFGEKIEEGIVSKVNMTIKTNQENEIFYSEDIIKISLNIDQENTGAAVLNRDGELLGILSSKINSMIPINRIKNILRRLEQEGEFKEAYLGIDGFDNYALKYMNIDYKSETGIYVDKVDQTSPAFEKIYEGDIITQIDDLEIAKMQDINEYLYTKNPKDKIKIHLIRGTKELEVTCELGSKK